MLLTISSRLGMLSCYSSASLQECFHLTSCPGMQNMFPYLSFNPLNSHISGSSHSLDIVFAGFLSKQPSLQLLSIFLSHHGSKASSTCNFNAAIQPNRIKRSSILHTNNCTRCKEISCQEGCSQEISRQKSSS